ncbi:MAG: fused MFS/spermidine synthase [Chloroflexota bacterium]|nr:fused MFS/spermidine synthase [Chloroflexota bacterium]
MLPLFTVTIFLGAVLVFGVQPIAARMLLPSFGGSPAVWSATSVFFQVALLAGYGYSFLLTRILAPRRQPLVHLLALAAPVLFLPLSLPLLAAPAELDPAVTVLGLLAVGLGVPFTIASTTGPLLQRWFSYTSHRSGRDPYFLYAASNAGSLLVLLAYPFLIEPRLDLGAQSATWSIGYLLFAVLGAVCALTVIRQGTDAAALAGPLEAGVSDAAPTWTARARWIVLAAVPSALSLGATAYISTDIAAVPLLWIAPLSLYLLSFIIAFSSRIRVAAGRWSGMLPWIAAAIVIPSGGLLSLPTWLTILLHLGFLLIAATMCHTLLAEQRPAPARLTEFYLLVAVGGALGGIFVSLVAPLIFDRVWEYPIAIGLALLLRSGPLRIPGRRVLIGLALILLAAIIVAGVALGADPLLPEAVAAPAIAVGLLVLLIGVSGIRLLFAALALAILAMSVGGTGAAIHTDRTFFGVYRVTAADGDHLLIHGSTVHGVQHTDPAMRRTPTVYYHRTGPVGQLFEEVGADLEQVAVLGLGIGTLASYSEAGQHFTFFEIDPAMVEIARDPSLFTFLADAAGEMEVVVADGRLGLSADPRTYDMVVLDAFTSDAIPVHLLTREAVASYLGRLAPDGIIVMNISNRFLDLESAVGAVADSLRLVHLVRSDVTITPAETADGKTSSTWVLLAAEPERLDAFAADPRWRPARIDESIRPWTDDFSDILAVLR